ncbi:Lrp/AsnC family transcriptional regulator [Fodinisporobacter ferrooxydans]|uniref:Lrp/AsnC family transcriptional regulator n=1 Tax=Fodinisporobacter ferrooxydans TaxID=2901836 RepID=A0ABY4CNB0_9BACL|nr:Lrp/AsnC family transcriptional regulator [Alicyclobacillaceae bacterium MYW30-H2]
MKPLMSNLDDLDYEIVKFLQDNARTPFTHIAGQLGVTERTIRTRVQQLQKDGILRLVGVVNPVKAGIRVQSIVQLSVRDAFLDQVVEKLNELDEVRLIVLMTGEFQLLLEVFTRTNEELSDFVMNKLNKIEGITRSNVMIQLKHLKSKYKFIR